LVTATVFSVLEVLSAFSPCPTLAQIKFYSIDPAVDCGLPMPSCISNQNKYTAHKAKDGSTKNLDNK